MCLLLDFWAALTSHRPRLIIVRDESARLSLGMVATPRRPLPFCLTKWISAAQFALQGSKHALDLRQLHTTCPQHRRVFAAEIAAQQIVSIALLGSLELRLVGVKRECRARDFFILRRKLNLHEAEGAARFLLRRADTQHRWRPNR